MKGLLTITDLTDLVDWKVVNGEAQLHSIDSPGIHQLPGRNFAGRAYWRPYHPACLVSRRVA